MLCPYLAPFQLFSLRALHHLGSGDWGIPNLKYDLQVWICQGKGRSPKKNPEKVIQRINLSLILESCENPTFLKTFAHTVSLLSFFLYDSSNISFWMIPPIFPFFTRTYCNYIWSGPARQSLRGKEAEARNATRQPAPCLMSFTGSTKIFF